MFNYEHCTEEELLQHIDCSTRQCIEQAILRAKAKQNKTLANKITKALLLLKMIKIERKLDVLS